MTAYVWAISPYVHVHTTQLSIDNAHTHACTRAYIHTRTHTLTRLLEKGVRIWEGMVLCIRPSLAIGIHQGTLHGMHSYVGAYDFSVLGGGGGEEGEGQKVVSMQLHVYIHRVMCMCVW